MKKKSQRQRELIRIIQSQGLLPVKNLASMLAVSEMTIRRDLDELQDLRADPAIDIGRNGDYSLLQALERSSDQKNRIGQFAASLIEPNDVIIIDTGSTTARMLPYLPADYHLTVVCYNANVLLELRSRADLHLMFCGGVYHPNTEMLESAESIQFINRIRANKLFLSAAGIHKKLGITCANTYEVPTKRAVIQSSLERILLVNSSKFDQIHSAYFCELDEVNTIITDRNLSEEWCQFIRDSGITLYLV